MTYDEYLAAVAAVTAALAATVLAISAPYQVIALTRSDWLSFLAATYPYVESARREIADLSRTYYDSERANHVPPVRLPLFDREPIIGPNGRPIRIIDDVLSTALFYEQMNINLAPYSPDWYEEAMDAVVEDLIKAGTTENGVARVISLPVKEAENGGRRTAIWAVDDDPNVVGWARVQGGEDSCGFCAMLISRGPVYKKSKTAGLNAASDTLAVELWRQAAASDDDSVLDELMNRWHPNCDCKVVPVFDRFNWPGRDQYLEMSKAWEDHAKGKTTEDRFNAFRRYIEGGKRDNLIQLPTAA